MAKIAYSYVRFSTPEQLKGDSLRRQLSLSTSWCERNGYSLDESLRLRDLGVSAWRGKNASEGRLGAFLQAVEDGRVRPGAVLLVESLDRLSRSQVGDALQLFLGILRQGIRIVTLSPEEEFDQGSANDLIKLLVAIIIMSRAYEESAMKSARLGAAWRDKRDRIAEVKITAKCPAWLQLSVDRTHFEPIPDRVAIVQRIFRMAIDGMGVAAIAKRLNGEQVPPLGRASAWGRSSVLKLLQGRQALGEYQPHTGHGSRERAPVGEPVPEYYPSIITEGDFYRAQQALRGRTNRRGPVGQGVANLFTGALRDARDGSPMVLVDKGKKSTGKAIVSSAAARGVAGSCYIAFPYAALERGILETISELTPADLVGDPGRSGRLDRDLTTAESKLADLDRRVKVVRNRIRESDRIEPLLDLLQELDAERDGLAAEVERLRAERRAATDDTLGSAQGLVALLASTEGQELHDLRARLRGRLGDLIATIWILVQTDGDLRVAIVQVHLRRGGLKNVWIFTRKGRLELIAGQATPDGISPETARSALLQLWGEAVETEGLEEVVATLVAQRGRMPVMNVVTPKELPGGQ